jgi:hypothetical protein
MTTDNAVNTCTMHLHPGGPPPDAAAFARLVQELDELAYEPSRDGDADTITYTTTDGPLRVVIRPPTVCALTMPGTDGWEITVTATTPDPIQLMVLYAVLNGHGDPATAVQIAAAALGVDLRSPDATPKMRPCPERATPAASARMACPGSDTGAQRRVNVAKTSDQWLCPPLTAPYVREFGASKMCRVSML